MAMAAPVVVIGCGRRDFGDDALGALVADRLAELQLPEVDVWVEESPAVDLLDRLKWTDGGNGLLVIVDAALAGPGAPAGTWTRIDYRRQPKALRGRMSASTHSPHCMQISEYFPAGPSFPMNKVSRAGDTGLPS